MMLLAILAQDCCNWAAGVWKRYARSGVPSLFSGGRVRNVGNLAFLPPPPQGHASPRHVINESVWEPGCTFRVAVLLLVVPSFARIAVVCAAIHYGS